ncbi:MAG: dynamin family protein [Desulfobacteraceae bacterium]|nr:dynamin family protein [Desulfobacteraceae bacterium]
MTEQNPKQLLLQSSRSLCELLERAEREIPGTSGDLFSEWHNSCRHTEQRLDDDLLHMGVVGTIKSGKSTFINALLGGDYLKRGAGVITSIVTKVRRSDSLRAVLTFKSWAEINQEIRQALTLFSSGRWRSSTEPFDLRRESDRRELSRALESLESRYLMSRDTRSVSAVLLSACLKGYPYVKDLVSEDTATVTYSGQKFYAHQDFAGSEDLSVFLKDLHLEIDTNDSAGNIEIADCQGSDSPNPLHLAMIQDYLRTSDLIIYVISSRTGIRQADINFMSMIKQIGGMSNVLFVVNFDFNEHEDRADLERVVEKIREDLSLMTDSPSVYPFSCLYALFDSRRQWLTEKDAARLSQWESETALATFSESEKNRFEADFRHMITEQRYSILLRNQLQRLRTTAADFHNWLTLNREIFSADADGAGTLMKRIKQQQKKTEKIRHMVNSTLDGASQQLKKETKAAVDRFFDIRHGEIVPGTLDFISGYNIAYDQYKDQLAENGFADTLFTVFQNFKEQLDRYMAETVNPRLFRFARENEAYIQGYFESITRPYETMVRETLGEFQARSGRTESKAREHRNGPEEAEGPPISLDAVKKNHAIDLPDAATTLAYSSGLKTEAFMKLGYYRFIQTMKRLARRGQGSGHADISALKSGVAKMKRETETTIVFHFKNYRENLKFQYLFRLIDATATELNQWLVNRFQTYRTDLNRIREMTNKDQADKEQALSCIDEILTALGKLDRQLDSLQKDLPPGAK